MSALIIENLTWPELDKKIKNVKLALVPVGSCEQHGANSTFYTDAGRADAISKLLAERLGDLAVSYPPVNYGVSLHHMDFPGTVTLRPETLINLLEDIAISISQHGINKILFLEGHGGNDHAIACAATTLKQQYGIEAYWTGFGSRTSTGGLPIPGPVYGHADEFEISSTLGLCPQYVREDRVAGIMQDSPYTGGFNGGAWSWKYDASLNGAVGDARKATTEIGERMRNEALDYLEKLARTIIAYEAKGRYYPAK